MKKNVEEDVEDDDDIEEDHNQYNQGFFNNQAQLQGVQSLDQQPQQFSFNNQNVNNMQMPPAPPDGSNRFKF